MILKKSHQFPSTHSHSVNKGIITSVYEMSFNKYQEMSLWVFLFFFIQNRIILWIPRSNAIQEKAPHKTSKYRGASLRYECWLLRKEALRYCTDFWVISIH